MMGNFIDSIFVPNDDEDFLQSGNSVKVSIPFLNGLVASIWRRFDEDESGFLQRKEFYKFFEDIFKGAGMDGFRIDQDQLEYIYNKIDVT